MKRLCAVFDVDDTVYLERDYVHSGFCAVGAWAAGNLDDETFGDRCWRKFLQGCRRSIFNDSLIEAGRVPQPELISKLVHVYRTHVPRIGLTGDSLEALKAIGRLATIAVITDGPRASQSRKVEALGLRSYAATIVLTDELGEQYGKPHPKAFQQVHQCQPAGVYVYIADNPAKDFTAPKQLGWKTVRVRRPQGLHYAVDNGDIVPDFEMADCSTLADLLMRL